MTGSIRQRGTNSWELRVYGGTDPITGRRRWHTRTVRGSRTEAQSELVNLAAVANVAPAVGARVTLAELLERWLGVSAPSWAPTTVRNTRSIVARHLVPGLGHVLVSDLTTVVIDEFYADLRTSGGQEGQPVSIGTVRRIHGVLHRALAQALRWEWIWHNPASTATPPPSQPLEMRPPNPSELALLLDHVADTNPLFHLFLVLAATTGARRGQLLALRWGDVDLDRGALRFQRALVEGPEGPVLVPTKTRRPHQVALDPSTHALVVERYSQVRWTDAGIPCAFVFTSDPVAQRPWLPNRVTKQFIDARRRAGLGRFRLHDLRHFMATEMLNAGVPVPIVSARLAHARASTTLNVYAHAVPGGDQHAARTIADILAAR